MVSAKIFTTEKCLLEGVKASTEKEFILGDGHDSKLFVYYLKERGFF